MININKVLLFIKTPPPTTGATLMNQYVAESELLKENFNIKTIGISYNKSLNRMGNWEFGKFFKIIKYSIRLIKHLITFKPDLVYFQISPLGFAFIRDSFYVLILKFFRKKIVFHIHGKGIKKRLTNPIKKNLYKLVFKKQYIITLSELLDYDIESVYSGNIYNVPNGIPKSTVPKLNREIKKEVQLLYLSNLIKSKGVLDFIKALILLNNKGINFNAKIVGKEADLSEIELNKIIKRDGLDKKLQYLGSKYGKDKNKILENTDVLVFPTKNDIFGLVNIEAMQYSIPVISTNEGAIPEIINDGITGFIVDKNAPEQIAEKIEYLINNPEERIEMGKAGRKKFLEKYIIEIFEKNMKNVFEDILSKKK